MMNVLEIKNPNILGEALREVFFDCNKGFGGYSSIHLNKDIEILDREFVPWVDFDKDGNALLVIDRPSLDNDISRYQIVAKYKDIKMRWYYAHDGTLEFHFPDGRVLINDDCKKDRGWIMYSSIQQAYLAPLL